MKLYHFYADGCAHVGADVGGGIVDATAAGFAHAFCDVVADAALLDELRALCGENSRPVLDEENLRHAPLAQPGSKILCVGLNYRRHALECALPIPEHPVFFSKFSDALCVDKDAIPLPETLSHFDHECELVVVMGGRAQNVTPGQAQNLIFGYACGNDFSARDGQFVTSQWLPGKAGYRFGPVGPCVVTRDAFDPYAPNRIACSVNGTLVQDSVTSDMIFGCREIVSYASRYFRLEAGDLIFTGTPSGVIHGAGGKRPWLAAGDVMTVEIEGIGKLTNSLA